MIGADQITLKKDEALYFFTSMKKKVETGSRPNRVVAGKGYWKSTCGDKDIICCEHGVVGQTKALTYQSMPSNGTAKDGKKTNWIMHEFKLKNDSKVVYFFTFKSNILIMESLFI